jgi:hypothetical protein
LPPFAGNFHLSARNVSEGRNEKDRVMFPKGTEAGRTRPGMTLFFELSNAPFFLNPRSNGVAVEPTQSNQQLAPFKTAQKPYRKRTESARNCKETVQLWSVSEQAS